MLLSAGGQGGPHFAAGGTPGGSQTPSFLPGPGHFITLSASGLSGLDDVITMVTQLLQSFIQSTPAVDCHVRLVP